MPSFVILWLILDLLLVAAGAFLASCFAPACIRCGRLVEVAPPAPADPSRPPVLDYARRVGPRFARYYGLVLGGFQALPLTVSVALAIYLAAIHDRAELPLAFVVVGFIMTAAAAAASACMVRWFRLRIRANELPRLGQFRKRAGILASVLLVLFPLAAWGAHRWVCWRMENQYEQALAQLGLTADSFGEDREDLFAIALPPAEELLPAVDGPDTRPVTDGELGSSTAESEPVASDVAAGRPLDKHAALAMALAEIERNHGHAIAMMPFPIMVVNLSGSEPVSGTVEDDLPYLVLERGREFARENPAEALRWFRAWTWLVDDLALGMNSLAVSHSLNSRHVALSTLQALLPLISDERQLLALTPPRSLVDCEALPQIIDAEWADVAKHAMHQMAAVSWLDWLKSLLPQRDNRNSMQNIGRPDPNMIFHNVFVLSGKSISERSYLRLQSERAKRGELWQALPPNDPLHKSSSGGFDLPAVINAILHSESQRVVWQSAVEATRFRLRHGHLPADAAEVAQMGLPTQPPAAVSSSLRITIQPSPQALRIACEDPSSDFAPSVVTLQPSPSPSR